jgi:hypothetical protein
LPAAVVAFLPVLLADVFADNMSSVAGVGLKIALFLAGCFVFQRMLRATKFFAEDERQMLFEMLETRGLGRAARLL